jgi:ubiquinone/menaquinone biosynthesis C-methylase UbiE
MSWYDRHILPRLIDWSCGLPRVASERRKVVPLARGCVLDVGIGSGRNLSLYDPQHVTALVGIDPSAELLAYTRERSRRLAFPVELVTEPAETTQLPSASFDTVVLTYTLCSIPDAARALQQIRRVLKPDGQLLFCEHGAAPDPSVRRWQQRVAPAWKRLAGGCDLVRDAPALLHAAGFSIDRLDTHYLAQTPRLLGYHSIGVAHAAR